MTWAAASAAALTLGAGAMALLRPGLLDARLTSESREVFSGVARAVLDGSLPDAGAALDTALRALLDRIDTLVAALPPHAQAELSQLLALLASTPGRKTLAGLHAPWTQATVVQTQAALMSMRVSNLALRRQAYQALHDIVGGAYFADAATWPALGYPGPVKI